MISRRSRPMVFGAGLWMFGQFIDRYATDAYGPPVGVLKAIERAGTVGKLAVVDINYPFEPGVSVEDVRRALERAALRAIAVTPLFPRQMEIKISQIGELHALDASENVHSRRSDLGDINFSRRIIRYKFVR